MKQEYISLYRLFVKATALSVALYALPFVKNMHRESAGVSLQTG